MLAFETSAAGVKAAAATRAPMKILFAGWNASAKTAVDLFVAEAPHGSEVTILASAKSIPPDEMASLRSSKNCKVKHVVGSHVKNADLRRAGAATHGATLLRRTGSHTTAFAFCELHSSRTFSPRRRLPPSRPTASVCLSLHRIPRRAASLATNATQRALNRPMRRSTDRRVDPARPSVASRRLTPSCEPTQTSSSRFRTTRSRTRRKTRASSRRSFRRTASHRSSRRRATTRTSRCLGSWRR